VVWLWVGRSLCGVFLIMFDDYDFGYLFCVVL